MVHQPHGNEATGSSCVQGQGIFHLRVGYHLLDGKQVALKKPLAVLQSHSEDSSGAQKSGKHYEVHHMCQRVTALGQDWRSCLMAATP